MLRKYDIIINQKLFTDLSELKLKYQQLSSINDHWLPRMKKIFITSRDCVCDVIFVTNDDTVYGFGDNIFAILGMETPVTVTKPKVIEELCGKDIKKVVFGDRFMVVLTESNELYTGGLCGHGRCGNGIDSEIYCEPDKIIFDNQLIVDVCCGLHYTVLLTDKQQVYIFGTFDSVNNRILSPTLIREFEEIKGITSISCGNYHALALTQQGEVYAWGRNYSGQLGLKHNFSAIKPELVEMPNNVSVKQISCGIYHSLLLTTEGNIYSFGYNRHGQLGHNHENNINFPTLIATKSRFTEILAFDCQSFAMNESNRIEFWGQNITGDISSPHQTEVGSLQEAIIQYMEYPFTIEPIILNKVKIRKPIEANNCLPSNRVMRTMVKAFNNPKNTDFQFKIKREECDDQEENCPSDDPNNGFETLFIVTNGLSNKTAII